MGRHLRLFRRKQAAPPPRLVDDGTLTELGGVTEVEDVAAGDGVTLAALSAQVEAGQPVLIRHVLLVNDAAAAEALAAAVATEGYDTRIDTRDGGWTWIVAATETTADLSPARTARARARMTSLAARHGAEYEGWHAATP